VAFSWQLWVPDDGDSWDSIASQQDLLSELRKKPGIHNLPTLNAMSHIYNRIDDPSKIHTFVLSSWPKESTELEVVNDLSSRMGPHLLSLFMVPRVYTSVDLMLSTLESILSCCNRLTSLVLLAGTSSLPGSVIQSIGRLPLQHLRVWPGLYQKKEIETFAQVLALRPPLFSVETLMGICSRLRGLKELKLCIPLSDSDTPNLLLSLSNSCPCLSSVDIAAPRFSLDPDDDIIGINMTHFPSLPQLSQLALRCVPVEASLPVFGPGPLKFLSLERVSGLVKLELRDSNVSEVHICDSSLSLVSVFGCKSLTKFCFSFMPSDSQVRTFQLIQCPALTSVQVAGRSCTNSYHVSIVGCPKVERLDILDDHEDYIKSAAAISCLRLQSVRGTNVWAVEQRLNSALFAPFLTKLCLLDVVLSGTQEVELQLPALKHFMIECHNIPSLPRKLVLNCPELTHLDLSCHVSDEQYSSAFSRPIEHLDLDVCKKLLHIHLSTYCFIGGSGKWAFDLLKSNVGLQKDGNNVVSFSCFDDQYMNWF